MSRPLAPASSTTHETLFELLSTNTTSIDFVHHWNTEPRYERLLNSSTVGGGVAIGDYDNDGRPDLCLTRPAGGFRLYRNLGDFRFTDVTDRATPRNDQLWTTGTSFADVNGDGHLDLYVCSYNAPNRLFLNQGNGTLIERAKDFGLDFAGASMMIAFGDYDRDGHLDAYLLTAGLIPPPEMRFRVKFIDGRPVVPDELQEYWQIFYLPGERAAMAEAGQFDHLFHNNGNGTFTDVSQTAGIRGCDFGNAVLWWDYNHDGWPDLYVANDYFGPDHLYRNNHDGTFTDVTRDTLPHTPWTSMGADAADLNNDGLIDLLATDMSGTTHFQRMIDMIDLEKSGWFLEYPEPRQYLRNAVFLNTGLNRFLEAAHLLGMADTDWTWSILLGDLDNDSRVDVFYPNGMTRNWMDTDRALQAAKLPPQEFAQFWRAQPIRADRNLAFQNLGDLRFTNVSHAWALNHTGPSFGAALADLDGDADLDLVVNGFEAPVRLHRNNSRGHHQVKIQLRTAGPNPFAFGATLRLESDAGTQIRYVTPAHGFMSATEPVVHFGLGAHDRIQSLTVLWPDGHQSICRDLPADQFYTLTKATNTPPAAPTPTPPTLFRPSQSLTGLDHLEASFDDFARQPLLPWKLSELGPGMAWGDLNNDGLDDLYVSGTREKPGHLLLRQTSGSFKPHPAPLPAPLADEMAPLFFDANNDGFLDLFIVTGSTECEPNDPTLRDRLFLNDGSGKLAPAPDNALPELRDSGSAAVAADFDRDGDIDLFVGSRSVPGQYPITPRSRLLQNRHGQFTDATELLAPGLSTAGLVTGALWSDVDANGWIDLFVTCEWGPIRLFSNQQGRLVERTREAGLTNWLGWWTAITGGDLDNDGDIDYVVSNLGRNSRYQPSQENPHRLYYGDFAQNGSIQVIEARLAPDGLLPTRGRNALASLLPNLPHRFPTHHQYASATLPDIIGPQTLAATPYLEVNTPDSGILRNDGHGHFNFLPLPRLAQIAPTFGTTLADVDANGTLDLLLGQNHFGMHRETGRLSGGVGLLLLGNGDGTFLPVWPNHSGIVIPGEARSLTPADLNGDDSIDFVVGINHAGLLAFENSIASAKTNRTLTIQLQGPPGSPTAVGTRVILHLKNGTRQATEVYAGGGFLSQTGAALRFGLGATNQVERIEIFWPHGARSSHGLTPGQSRLQIRQPSP